MVVKTKISIFALRKVRYEKFVTKTLRNCGKIECKQIDNQFVYLNLKGYTISESARKQTKIWFLCAIMDSI